MNSGKGLPCLRVLAQGLLVREAFLDHAISNCPHLSATTHCSSKWSSFLHSMYHLLTYLGILFIACAPNWKCKHHENNSLYLCLKQSRYLIIIC